MFFCPTSDMQQNDAINKYYLLRRDFVNNERGSCPIFFIPVDFPTSQLETQNRYLDTILCIFFSLFLVPMATIL